MPMTWLVTGFLCKVLFAIFAGIVYKSLITLYKRRSALDGLPKPPFSFFWGNLIAVGELTASLPESCHPHMLVHYLRKKYDLPPIFYIDTWPFGPCICAVTDPEIAHQMTVKAFLPKGQEVADTIWPLAGVRNLVCMNGLEHKRWRAIFNPGFSNAHLMSLVGGIVDDALSFTGVLAQHAEEQDMFMLEQAATKVTIDVIGRVVLDIRMHAQTSKNAFVTAFLSQVSWLLPTGTVNPFRIFNPLRPLVFQYNIGRMNKFVSKVIDERFASRSIASKTNQKKRPIIDLALDAYLSETNSTKVDATFKRFARDQIKVFMFAGHDTTSSTICYIAYMLSKHPDALRNVLQEYDNVFGKDIGQTAQAIKADPYLLNKLPYSVAVIKETLRLFPPASTVRAGVPGFFLHYDGNQYPTEGFMVWGVSYAIHRHPKFWPQPDSFIPERWIVKEGDPLFPIKGAWRPFDFGPRTCIGMELVWIETKIIMALMLRSFDIRPAYAEMDTRKANSGVTTTPEGERAYQSLIATAKPVDGMPVRVTRR